MSKRGWILVGSAVPVLAFFALLGWASVRSGGNPGGLGVNSDLGEVSVTEKPASQFSLELLDGRTLALSDYLGKVVMVDFWASWCRPCRQEAPVLAKVYREYAGLPVEFIGIDIWDGLDAARDYVSWYELPYPNGVDGYRSYRHRLRGKGYPGEAFRRSRRYRNKEVRRADGPEHFAVYPGRFAGFGDVRLRRRRWRP